MARERDLARATTVKATLPPRSTRFGGQKLEAGAAHHLLGRPTDLGTWTLQRQARSKCGRRHMQVRQVGRRRSFALQDFHLCDSGFNFCFNAGPDLSGESRLTKEPCEILGLNGVFRPATLDLHLCNPRAPDLVSLPRRRALDPSFARLPPPPIPNHSGSASLSTPGPSGGVDDPDS